jgi:hypothetical protein
MLFLISRKFHYICYKIQFHSIISSYCYKMDIIHYKLAQTYNNLT